MRRNNTSGPSAETSGEKPPISAPGSHRNAFILVSLGGAVLVGFGLAGLAGIVAPVFLALILTICVHPLRLWLEKHGVSRGLASGSVIIAVILLLAAFAYAFLLAFGQFSQLLPQFADQMKAFGQAVVTWLNSIGISSRELSTIASDFEPASLVGFVGRLIGDLAGITGALVILLTIAMLLGMDAGYFSTILAQVGRTHALVVSSMSNYATNVRRYMVWTTLLGVLQGFINFIALVILGVPGAFIWAVLAFLCSFIPNIGYFIAIIPPIIFGALVGGWPTVIAVIVVYGVINAVVQSLIQPRVVGNAVSLSQTITFFSVLLWAVILGPIGAILAIPLTLLVRLMLVDTNPSVTWVGPLLGELTETKAIMAAEDAKSKAARKSRPPRSRAATPSDAAPES